MGRPFSIARTLQSLRSPKTSIKSWWFHGQELLKRHKLVNQALKSGQESQEDVVRLQRMQSAVLACQQALTISRVESGNGMSDRNPTWNFGEYTKQDAAI